MTYECKQAVNAEEYLLIRPGTGWCPGFPDVGHNVVARSRSTGSIPEDVLKHSVGFQCLRGKAIGFVSIQSMSGNQRRICRSM